MSKKIQVVIRLDYDPETFDDEVSADEFAEKYLEDYVYEDLIDLMRGDKLRYWAEIEVS